MKEKLTISGVNALLEINAAVKSDADVQALRRLSRRKRKPVPVKK